MTTLLNGKKSIRLDLFWSCIYSFVLSFLVGAYLANYINQLEYGYLFNIANLTIMVLTFILFFYLFTRRIVRYLLTLANGLNQISSGNLQYRVPIQRQDELGNVALSINHMADQMEQLIQKERKMEQSKMELITGVSHDLRTPLTSIIGYVDLLRTRAFRDEQEYERFIENTYNKAIYLKDLIDELFEYTRLTSNIAPLHLQTIKIKELLEQMLFEFEPIAQENQVTLIKKINQSEIHLEIDNEKFVRAIDNLLMNALKFSIKPGEISVSMTYDVQFLYITIENMGTPITKQQEEQLFERFYKVDISRNTQSIMTGAGLGLSITQNIIQQHGGEITLSHQTGHFAFTVKLPILHDFFRNSL
ncbi:HAMP domain-containing protein [Paenibacillus sp. LMG 31460]|uniref:histidine kinase n=2 Tax=Paenibacillus germinis TaxID=2654979 RepID=A0ABX1Z1T1_9BACL|nr:HAMP domain-containing protein [Paenibacillus germinis]